MDAGTSHQREQSTTALRLLVVEDNLASLELMTEVFTSLHAEVVPINDSVQATSVVNRERFDGIFLDLEMPRMHGFDLARHIRASNWNKSTPIIIVTGREDRQTMQQAFASGATFFLQKPVDRQKLSGLFRTVRGGLFEFRRRHLRVPLQTAATCEVGSRTIRGTTQNLSPGGVQIEGVTLPATTMVRVKFSLPTSGEEIRASGSIVWTKEDRIGVSFTNVSEENRQRIRQFVAEAEKSADA